MSLLEVMDFTRRTNEDWNKCILFFFFASFECMNRTCSFFFLCLIFVYPGSYVKAQITL